MYEVDGRPYQILAVSLPFVVLYCPINKHAFPVDKRYLEFQILDRAYVEIFKKGSINHYGGSFAPAELPRGLYSGHEEDDVNEYEPPDPLDGEVPCIGAIIVPGSPIGRVLMRPDAQAHGRCKDCDGYPLAIHDGKLYCAQCDQYKGQP
jgi:hypothetical protein